MQDQQIFQNNIKEIAYYLMTQTTMPLWSVADAEIIYAGAKRAQVSRGPRGALIQRLYRHIGSFGILPLLSLKLIGIAVALRLWWKAGSNGQLPDTPFRLFVGFGAGPEENMWLEYSSEQGPPAYRVDQTDPASLGRIARPGLISLIKAILTTSAAVVSGMRSGSAILKEYSDDFMTFAAIRIGDYAFHYEWWKIAKGYGLVSACFLAADTPAFACIDSGAPDVEFRQHGLLEFGIIFPAFSRLYLLTADEADYMRELLPESTVHITRQVAEATEREPVMVIASIYDIAEISKTNYLSKIHEILLWAKKERLRVMIRPHPREDIAFWQAHFPDLSLDMSSISMRDFLVRMRPRFLVSWFSTALIDALQHGIIPVTLSEMDEEKVLVTVVPLAKRSLIWPNDRDLITELTNNESAYKEMVYSLRHTS